MVLGFKLRFIEFLLLSFIAFCNFLFLTYLLKRPVLISSSWWRLLGIWQVERSPRFPLRRWVTVILHLDPSTLHPFFSILLPPLLFSVPREADHYGPSHPGSLVLWLFSGFSQWDAPEDIRGWEEREVGVWVLKPMLPLPVSFFASLLWPQVLSDGSSLGLWLFLECDDIAPPCYPPPSSFKPRDGNSLLLVLVSGHSISCRWVCFSCQSSDGYKTLNKSCKFSESQFPFM